MPSSTTSSGRFANACLLLCLLAWQRMRQLLQPLQQLHQPATTLLQATVIDLLMAILCLASVLALSGCGTAPLSGATLPPVPATLLQPPETPKLLVPRTPGSTSMTPGPINKKTPAPVRATGSGTKG